MTKFEYLKPYEFQMTCLYSNGAISHGHQEWEFVMFLDGISENVVNDCRYKATRGDLFLMSPKHKHEIVALSENHYHRDIYITNKEFADLCGNLSSTLYDFLSNKNDAIKLNVPENTFNDIQERLAKFDTYNTLNGYKDSQKSIIFSIISYFLGIIIEDQTIESKPIPNWLLKTIQNIQKPLVFCKRLYEIVEETGYSYTQFSVIFKKNTGQPLIGFITSLRLNYAATMLSTTNKSVLNISSLIGYDSLSYFIKTFKNKFGYTPQKYRCIHNSWSYAKKVDKNAI